MTVNANLLFAQIGELRRQVTTVVNIQTGTTYELQESDNGNWITLNNGAAITVTVPAGLPANFSCVLQQLGAGQVTVVDDGTTSLVNVDSQFAISGQYGIVTIFSHASEVYTVSGNTA